MNKLENFHEDFVQLYLRDAESRGLLITESFFDKICNDLAEEGELTPEFEFAQCKKIGIDVVGYDYDSEREILYLINHEIFQNDNKIETLTKGKIESKFKNAENFFEKCKNNFSTLLDETSPEFEMAFEIETLMKNKKIKKIKFILLTDGSITKALKEIPGKIKDNIDYEYRIIDINYLYHLEMANYENQSFSVDVNLPAIKASTDESEYTSYLAVISGETIANIYDKYGKKLLEQNVRTFLQFRGKVNKGLRNTIEHHPSKFFAYNNGITATGSRIDIDPNTGNIKKIYDFQIVNGGQTTSSIYAAKKVNKLNLDKINVQMKISVVKQVDKLSEFVSKVAEYANTQNKVNKSDFFSNSPFHKEMKKHSERIFVPLQKGQLKKTRWYYERVRGEYLNDQAYRTSGEKKAFQSEYPKHQLIDKTLLGKAEVSWLQKPFIVSKGAQYCFIEFSNSVTAKLEKDNLSITESYFKESIAKIILFKHLEKKISKQVWYRGGYRAQIVTYTISYLSHDIEKMKKFLNFEKIWNEQSISNSLNKILLTIAEILYEVLLNGTSKDANIGSWAKKQICWDDLKKVEINIEYPNEILKDKETVKLEKRKVKKEQKMMKGIDIQIFVVQYENWEFIYNHYRKYLGDSGVTEKQFSILQRIINGEFPSEAQSKLAYKVYEVALEDGIIEKD